jgi:hypothetical protein
MSERCSTSSSGSDDFDGRCEMAELIVREIVSSQPLAVELDTWLAADLMRVARECTGGCDLGLATSLHLTRNKSKHTKM